MSPGAVERVARRLLVLLALVLPFEVPLFRVGPIQVTSVELVMYVMLAAWGALVLARLIRRCAVLREALARLRSDSMIAAVVLFAFVVFASALAAPSHRAEALKFALRSLCGVLVFFATRALVRQEKVAWQVSFALIVGALLSAATALFESFAPESASVLSVFHEQGFDTLGLTRASGVFAYPTIGAMYWEALVPLLVVVPFHGGVSRDVRSGSLVLAVSACGLLFGAILASATRSGLAGGALGCIALILLTRRWGTSVPRTSAGALVALVAVSVIAIALPRDGSLLAQRLRFWDDGPWFAATYEVPSESRSVRAGEPFETVVTLHNTGTVAWRHEGARPTRLANHWYFRDSQHGTDALVAFDGVRTDLPVDVPPGGVVRVMGVARAPKAEGTYRLAWDLVTEDIAWFSEHGSKAADEPIDVFRDVEGEPFSSLTEMDRAAIVPPPPGRWALWRAAVVLWHQHPLLGIGPDNFRRSYEAVLSPAPNGQPYEDTRIHANSLYFETLADTGLAGVIALLAVALTLVRALHAHWLKRRILGLASCVAAGLFFVHGGFDCFLEFTPSYGLYWMLLGLATAPGAAGSDSPAAPDNTR